MHDTNKTVKHGRKSSSREGKLLQSRIYIIFTNDLLNPLALIFLINHLATCHRHATWCTWTSASKYMNHHWIGSCDLLWKCGSSVAWYLIVQPPGFNSMRFWWKVTKKPSSLTSYCKRPALTLIKGKTMSHIVSGGLFFVLPSLGSWVSPHMPMDPIHNYILTKHPHFF